MKRFVVVAVISLALIGTASIPAAAVSNGSSTGIAAAKPFSITPDPGCPRNWPRRMTPVGWTGRVVIACSNFFGTSVHYFNASQVVVVQLIPERRGVIWRAGSEPSDYAFALTKQAIPPRLPFGAYRLLPKASAIATSRYGVVVVRAQGELTESGTAVVAKAFAGALQKRLVPKTQRVVKSVSTCLQSGRTLFDLRNYYFEDNVRAAILGADACKAVVPAVRTNANGARTAQQYADDAALASRHLGLGQSAWIDDVFRASRTAVRLIPQFLP